MPQMTLSALAAPWGTLEAQVVWWLGFISFCLFVVWVEGLVEDSACTPVLRNLGSQIQPLITLGPCVPPSSRPAIGTTHHCEL